MIGNLRIAELDSIRGIAALMVVFVHCLACYKQNIFNYDGINFIHLVLTFISGRAPVILFFVLSGFVLAIKFSQADFSAPKLISFYLRRLLRLIPAAYSGLLFAILIFSLLRLISDGYFFNDFITNPLIFNAKFINLKSDLLFTTNYINPVYWSLHVELIGGLLFPLFSILIYSKAWSRYLVLCIFLLLPFSPIYFTEIGKMTNALLYCFAAGILLHYLILKNIVSLENNLCGFFGLFILVGSHNLADLEKIFANFLIKHSILINTDLLEINFIEYLQHLCETFGAFLLVGHIVQRKNSLKFLNLKILKKMGDLSYSIYLLHLPIIALVGIVIDKLINISSHAQGIDLILFTFLMVLSITIPLSYLNYHIFEKPFINFSKIISNKWLDKTEQVG